MMCEPWMDRDAPKFDPVADARRNLRYWTDRKREMENGLAEAQKEWARAVEKLARCETAQSAVKPTALP